MVVVVVVVSLILLEKHAAALLRRLTLYCTASVKEYEFRVASKEIQT